MIVVLLDGVIVFEDPMLMSMKNTEMALSRNYAASSGSQKAMLGHPSTMSPAAPTGSGR